MGHEKSKYIAKIPDINGHVSYDHTEHKTWSFLYKRQFEVISQRACSEFLEGLEKLKLKPDTLPQAYEVNKQLGLHTGWAVEMVPAVIPAQDFFQLLSEKKFPMATFIRNEDEIDYLQEPDIFHEVFGHCPLLTYRPYADFVQNYGKISLEANRKQRKYLFRLFWFTIEFGLIKKSQKMEIYGGGILSSKHETCYALDQEKNRLQYLKFDILRAMRMPFRIDLVQPAYFYLTSLSELFDVLGADLLKFVDEAIELGDLPPERTVTLEGTPIKFTN